FAGAYACGQLGAVGKRVLGVKFRRLAGEALADDARGGVDENGQKRSPKQNGLGLTQAVRDSNPSKLPLRRDLAAHDEGVELVAVGIAEIAGIKAAATVAGGAFVRGAHGTR